MTVTTHDGGPWSPEAQRQAAQHQACTLARPWREWLAVTHADGRPWGEPVPNSAKIDRWCEKIAVELAADAGIAAEEAATFADANRSLIEDRFANKVARTDVVQELHELMESARMVLAAE